ncbi:ROK family protein [Jeotgalibaca caeni]|uniref:ROK family protein n=1 Tax=Jeotgalibaca caeni TaxID=3028623 RepID=UPI00237D5D4E|nr:ROK family protein [Jeotgalibaca caeni]MDE1549912.1 ROK family protein [Jeotgalibaca caeni]
MVLAVFDIGGTAVKYGVWDEEKIYLQNKFSTPSTWIEMKEEITRVFQWMEETTGKKMEGAAFSCPGAVHAEEGIIYGFSAVPYVHHFPIRAELEQLLGVPVSIENDANCAALAEVFHGAAADVENALFIIIGSGIGGAVILNRELVKGRNIFGGEFGFMLLEEDHTFSDLASPVRVASRYAEEVGLPPGSVSGLEMFQNAENQDSIALKYVEGLKSSLARGIQVLLVSFNPDKVIIGGAISTRHDLINEVSAQIKQQLIRVNATDVEYDIVPCHYHNDANLVGAVVAFEQQRQ